MAKSPKGLHHHVVVLKGRVFVTDAACGPGEHTHLLSIGDDVAETAPATAEDLTVRKSADCPAVAVDHAHVIEMFDGTLVETLLPADVLDAKVRKRLVLEIAELVFWKERFPEMAAAARWLDEQGQHWDRQTESPQFITFTVMDRSLFNAASLRTIHISDGVDAVVGTLELAPQPVDLVEPIQAPAVVVVEPPPDLHTFRRLKATFVAGYEMLDAEQTKALDNLRDDLAADLVELHKAVGAALPAVVGALNGVPDEFIETDVFLGAAMRAEAGLTLLADGLVELHAAKGIDIPDASGLEELAPSKWTTPLTVPTAVVKQAKTGLGWLGEGGHAVAEVLAHGEELAAGGELAPESVLRIRKQQAQVRGARGFATDGAPLAGEIAWRLLGGDAGERWVAKTAAALDREQAALARVVAAHADVVATKAASLAETFDGSSFDKFALVLKSTAESCRVVADNAPAPVDAPAAPVEKGLVPTAKMSGEQLGKAQAARAKKWNVEVTKDAATTFPAGFPSSLDDYGDPVNLKFPVDTVARARNARVRFKQIARETYDEESSKRVVHERIVRAEMRFGVEPDFDPDDPLDALLPQDLQEKLGQPVTKAAPPAAVPATDDGDTVEVRWDVRILKAKREEERTVFGIVLEPDVTDLHGDTYDEDVVRDAAWRFMEEFADTGLQHELIVTNKVRILESYVAPVDMELETDQGMVAIKKGTWLLRVRVRDDELWESVKAGEFTGFSFGGVARVKDLRAA